MKTFRLIGNPAVFNLERTFLSGNCIPAVAGVTPDGKSHAIAAESDVIWIDEAA